MANKYTTSSMIGVSRVGQPYPIFFDSHYPITQNLAPVTFISGSPGSGKTFFGLLLACQSNIMGKISIILDPKGDFTALKELSMLGMLDEVNIWNVASEDGVIQEENIGMLDPTVLYSNSSENTSLTLDIMELLTGKIDSSIKSVILPVVKDVVESENPSFMSVAQELNKYRGDERVRAYGMTLQNALSGELGQLLRRDRRSKKEVKAIRFNVGTTVANLMGLNLPSMDKKMDEYSTSERVSTAIMTLITQLVINSMRRNKGPRKTLIIDEAWSVASTPKGKNMISETALLGRSLNMSIILISQSPKHLDFGAESNLDNAITTRFAFRNPDDRDNTITVRAMKLEDPSWKDIIPTLDPGNCLMRDCLGNAGVVQILAPDDWALMFDTNPANAAKKRALIEEARARMNRLK